MTALYNDIEPFVCDWLENLSEAGHIAPGDVDRRSIVDLSPSNIEPYTQFHTFAGIGVWSYALRLAGWPDDLPVWTGSAPCQPFSVAGLRKGEDDERHLAPHWLALIRESLPPVIFGEQVASPAGREWLDDLSLALEALGYAVGTADICAAGVGAPHIRQRLFFGAARAAHPYVLRLKGECGTRQEGTAEHGDVHGLEHPDLQRREDERIQLRERPEGSGVPETGGERPTLLLDPPEDGRRVEVLGVPDGAVRGFWGRSRWYLGRDGGIRPTGPSVFPLAHGSTQRVERLRAYGNAIVPQVAATFIRSFVEALADD